MTLMPSAGQIAGTAEPDLIPIVLARPLLTPPRATDKPGDAMPLFVWLNPYSPYVDPNVETTELTLSLHVMLDPVYGRPVALQLGRAIFVGRQLLRGYPDTEKMPVGLWHVLADLALIDWREGRRDHWLLSPATSRGM